MSTPAKHKPRSPYCCNFCRQHLEPVPFEWLDYLRVFLLLQPFQCPHCFSAYLRPLSVIGRLPLIGLLFRGRSNVIQSSRSGILPHRDGDVNTPVIRLVTKLGRWVEDCEKMIGGIIKAIFRCTWAAIWFLPSLIFGRKRRRSSRSRFLKSLF